VTGECSRSAGTAAALFQSGQDMGYDKPSIYKIELSEVKV